MNPAQINSKFLNNLANTFGTKRFTTKQAEQLYERDHWLSCNDRYEYLGDSSNVPDHACYSTDLPDQEIRACNKHWRKRTNKEIRDWHKNLGKRIDNWGEMSARNTLAAATQCGLLIRISRGLYTFKGTF